MTLRDSNLKFAVDAVHGAYEGNIGADGASIAGTWTQGKPLPLEQTMKAFSCTELPIEYRDIHGLNRMRFFHPDPFDRLLMSQAAHRRSVYLATLDQNIIRTFKIDKAFYIFTDRAKKE